MSTLTTEYIANRLRDIVGPDRVSTNYIDLEAYMHNLGFNIFKHKPDFIIKPASDPMGNNPIARVVSFANRNGIPVVAKGGIGEGGSICREGGILIDMTDMNKILTINKDIQYVVVEAGASIYEIHRQLRKYDMLLPNFGTYESGTIASGAFVRGAVGYGATRYGFFNDLVIGLEVVFPDGEVVKFGALSNEDTKFGPFQKYANQPDFVGAFTNCHGNFGIITRMAFQPIEGKREWLHSNCYTFRRDQIEEVQDLMIDLVKKETYDVHITDRWCFYWPMEKGFIDKSKVPDDAWFFVLTTYLARTDKEAEVKEEQIWEVVDKLGGVENKHVCDKYKGNKGTERRWQAWHITGPDGWLTFLCRNCGAFFVTENSVPLNGFKETYELCEATTKKFGLWVPERCPTIDTFVTKYSGIKMENLMWYNPYDLASSISCFQWLEACHAETTPKGPCYLAPSMPTHKSAVFEKHGNTYGWFKRLKKWIDPNNIMNPGSLT